MKNALCHPLLLAAFLLLAFSLSTQTQPAPAANQPQLNQKPEPRCELTQDDYSVYSALINALGKPEDPEEAWQNKEILITTVTATPTYVKSLWGSWGFRSSSKAAPASDTVADFEVKARSSCPMEPRFTGPQPYAMITPEELDKTFKKKARGWEEFYKKHPRAAGYWEFSRPGYNAARDEAVLYVGHSCGDLCGTGHFYFLSKQNDQWTVRNRLIIWIS
jgi:hypothetical protein